MSAFKEREIWGWPAGLKESPTREWEGRARVSGKSTERARGLNETTLGSMPNRLLGKEGQPCGEDEEINIKPDVQTRKNLGG